ncbi:MAG: GNVR domain-containing protein [Candidatus Omnitrophota bacterium]
MENIQAKIRKPLEYLQIIFRRKWLLIIPIIIGIIAGIVAGNVLPKAYQASTLILVEEGRIINPLIQGLAISTSTAQRLAVLREQILGWDRMLQLIKALDLAKNVSNQAQFEALVKGLRKNIIVRMHGQSIISIAYEGPSPVESQNIVKTITDIFISENLKQQSRESEDAISFINDQLGLYQKKVKQADVAQMEDQLKKLLVDSTDKHPMVIELRKKISSAKEEINRGNYDVTQASVAGSDAELKTLKTELKKMKENLAQPNLDSQGGANREKLTTATNEKLYKLLLLEKMDQVATEDQNVNQKLYNTLLERLETAKITQRLESSKEGTRYTILDPARRPLKATKPNKIAVLFAGMFAGLCAGLALVFAVEMLDHSFLSVEDVKMHFNLPMLGVISRIVTETDIKVQKIRNTRITGISVATGLILAVFIIVTLLTGS